MNLPQLPQNPDIVPYDQAHQLYRDSLGTVYKHFNTPFGGLNVADAFAGDAQSKPPASSPPHQSALGGIEDFFHNLIAAHRYQQQVSNQQPLSQAAGSPSPTPSPSSSSYASSAAPNGNSVSPGADMTGAGTVIPYQQAHQMYQQSKNSPSPSPSATPHIQGGTINSFMQSLAQQESGGNYNATNKDSGAIGKYQIMPSNWSAWAKQAGLPTNAPPTPQNQEAVARNQIQALYNKYGNWNDVASVWYSGKPAAKANLTAPQGNYPPIGQYIESVLGRLTH